MRRLLPLLFTLLLASCSQFKTPPEPPPPAGPKAQEITRAQSTALNRLGTISVTVRGSPDDAERAIADKANAAGATWYVIQMVSETVMPGNWYSTAILYGPSVPATGAK
ncbi:biofilm peroxide resistance protein BsmA [Pantoea sp. BAV 3049]|uniref:biofilm peroxide resistance protein BsmA n=1 Tax=Pantoea sp. BAV 3049 TaxID=2654188 RepID=UPI00131BD766|nr:biofilm peroxide resistance protein BsmA [Pantoea sp. BAV 3049]